MPILLVRISLLALAWMIQFLLGESVCAESDLFARLDSNGDGRLSSTEIPSEQATLFRRLLRTADANTDGLLSAEEFQQGISPITPDKPMSVVGSSEFPGADALLLLLVWMDKNTDQTIEKNEVPAKLQPLFNLFLQQLQAKGAEQFRIRQLQQQSPRFAQLALRYAERQQIDVELELALLSDSQFAMVERLRNSVRPGQASTPREQVEAIFARLDQDGDGEIVLADLPDEVKERFGAMLLRTDFDRDGRITEVEFRRLRDPVSLMADRSNARGDAAKRIGMLLRRADRDGDGHLTLQESPPFLAARFEKIDSDGNGRLDRQELSQALEALRMMSHKSDPSTPKNRKPPKRPKN